MLKHKLENGASVLYLSGVWRLANLAAISDSLRSLDLKGSGQFLLDGSRLEALDTAAGFTLFRHLNLLGCTESMVSARGFDPRHARLLKLVHERMKCPPAAARSMHLGLVQRVGASAVRLWRLLKSHNAFVGALSLEVFELISRPRRFRLRETVVAVRGGRLDAIPIVALVTFLIGVVFAYLLGVQAQRYGATIFVVDGVGLAICRELSPMLVAVIVAGRSGAAFTAQIGSMKVQEETDAIRTLGLSPIQVLVIPRLVAIVVGAAAAGVRRRRRRHRRRHADRRLAARHLAARRSSNRLHAVLRAQRRRHRPGQGAGVRRVHRDHRVPDGHVGGARRAQRRREHHLHRGPEHRLGHRPRRRLRRRPAAAGDLMEHGAARSSSIVTRFGRDVVHDGVSFSIGRGEVVALIGGSGTGKSVLLKEIDRPAAAPPPAASSCSASTSGGPARRR